MNIPLIPSSGGIMDEIGSCGTGGIGEMKLEYVSAGLNVNTQCE
jgi:hypothetical protein